MQSYLIVTSIPYFLFVKIIKAICYKNWIISIHASLMGCNICQKKWSQSFWISIHASLMGCNSVALCCNDFRGISIHASLMGCNHPASSGFLPLAVFQFMHPLWDATAKYSIHIPIYTIFCIYCVILSSFISFTQSYLSIHLPLLVRISQCFYVRLRFAPASYSSLVQKT